MARVCAFTLANDVVNYPVAGGASAPALIAPQAGLRPQYVPSTFSFAFSISICEFESDKDLNINVIICDPDGKQVQEAAAIKVPASVFPSEDPIPVENRAVTINVSVRNFPISKEGVYQMIPYVNGTPLETQLIPVFKGRDAKNPE